MINPPTFPTLASQQVGQLLLETAIAVLGNLSAGGVQLGDGDRSAAGTNAEHLRQNRRGVGGVAEDIKGHDDPIRAVGEGEIGPSAWRTSSRSATPEAVTCSLAMRMAPEALSTAVTCSPQQARTTAIQAQAPVPTSSTRPP